MQRKGLFQLFFFHRTVQTFSRVSLNAMRLSTLSTEEIKITLDEYNSIKQKLAHFEAMCNTANSNACKPSAFGIGSPIPTQCSVPCNSTSSKKDAVSQMTISSVEGSQPSCPVAAVVTAQGQQAKVNVDDLYQDINRSLEEIDKKMDRLAELSNKRNMYTVTSLTTLFLMVIGMGGVGYQFINEEQVVENTVYL